MGEAMSTPIHDALMLRTNFGDITWQAEVCAALKNVETELTTAQTERDDALREVERLKQVYELQRQDIVNLTDKVIPNVREQAEAEVAALREALEAEKEAHKRTIDGLTAANVCNIDDAERWRTFVCLWAASTELKLTQDEDGTWSIFQVEPSENELFAKLNGSEPNAAIDKARRT